MSKPLIPLIALLGLTAGRASASEPAEVEALIEQANNLRRDGKDGKALPLMQKAYNMAGTARTAAQLGLVEVALGYWLQAEQHLAEALSSPRDPWIHQHRAELQRVLAGVKESIGELSVQGEPAGAEVVVNGQSVGTLPLSKPVRVGDGPVRLEVRAAGYQTSSQTLRMSKGAGQRVDIRLARAAVVVSPQESPPTKVAERSPSLVEQMPEQTSAAGPPATRMAAWATAAAATAALGVGVAGSLTWIKKRDAFDNHTTFVLDNSGMPTNRTRNDCGAQNENRGGDECLRLYDQMNGAKTFAVIGYVSGALLAAGAATLFLLAPSRDGNETIQSSLVCAPTLATVGGNCRLVF